MGLPLCVCVSEKINEAYLIYTQTNSGPKGHDEDFDLFSKTLYVSVVYTDSISDYQVQESYYKTFQIRLTHLCFLQETHCVHLLGKYCVEVHFNLIYCGFISLSRLCFCAESEC